MKKLYVLLMVLGMGSMQFASAAGTVDRTDFGIIDFSTSINSVEAPPALFDGYPETKWLSDHADPTPWMTYEFSNGKAYAINSYAMTSANDQPGRDPLGWVLLGTNDVGEEEPEWIEVDHRTGISWSARFERQVFKFTNTVAYKMYKLQVTANGGQDFTQFSELELFQDGISRTAYADITWSSQYSWNEGGLRAFDNMAEEGNFTKWGTGGNNTTGWLQYQFLGGRAFALNGYTITSANDAPERDPRDWTIQGSHNGTDWDILDTQTGQMWMEGEDQMRYTTKEYSFTNHIAYPYYKIDITLNNGSGNLLSFAEMELLESQVPGSADIDYPEEAAIEVPKEALLEWIAGTDTGIVGQYVLIGKSPAEMEPLNDFNIVDNKKIYIPISASVASFDPSSSVLADTENTSIDELDLLNDDTGNLHTDTTYYWQIESALTKDGETNNAQDPNNIFSRVWRFTTESSVVTFNPDYPEDDFAFPGEEVSFEVKATDPLGGEIAYQWYIDGDGNPDTNSETALVDGPDYEGVNTPVLIVKNGTPGFYRCGATNASKETFSSYAQLYVKEKLAHWTLDKAVDNTVYVDITGNGNDAVVDGTPTFTDGIVDGDMVMDPVTDGAIDILDPNSTAKVSYTVTETVEGEDVEVEKGFNPGEITGRFSISTWINRKEVAEDVGINMIAAKRNGWAAPEDSLWQFMAIEGTHSFRMQSYGLTTVNTGSNVFTDDEWVHVAVTFNGTHARIYVNGVQEAVGVFQLAAGPDSIFRIGRNDSLTERFEGMIDDMQVFNFDLSAEEVVDLYYADSGIPTCIYGNPTADINQDCDVNLLDIGMLAGEWLDHGFYPDRP